MKNKLSLIEKALLILILLLLSVITAHRAASQINDLAWSIDPYQEAPRIERIYLVEQSLRRQWPFHPFRRGFVYAGRDTFAVVADTSFHYSRSIFQARMDGITLYSIGEGSPIRSAEEMNVNPYLIETDDLRHTFFEIWNGVYIGDAPEPAPGAEARSLRIDWR